MIKEVPSRQRLAIVGAGRVGAAIAYLAQEKGYQVVGLCCRHVERAHTVAAFLQNPAAAKDAPGSWLLDADLILITTPDQIIRDTCTGLVSKGYIRPGTVVAHCSGAHPSSILESAARGGCPIGSVHPLQSCATKELAIQVLPGSYFCVEGSKEARRELKDLALAIGGKILEIDTADKPLYHAGAAVASNFLVSLLNFALSLYECIGIDRQSGIQALAPLFEGTIRNIKSVGIPEALTGPVMRGDLGTVETHLDAIAKKVPDYLALYCALGIETTKVALNKGTIDKKKGGQFSALFERMSRIQRP